MLALSVGCKEDNTVDPEFTGPPKSKSKEYYVPQGGVQITRVYFLEDSTNPTPDLTTEYLTLQTDAPTDLNGWKIVFGTSGQSFDLPFMLQSILEIHLQNRLTSPEAFQKTLSVQGYLLNNTHDYVLIKNQEGALIDSLGY